MSTFDNNGKTCVFWDVEDYPIPDGLDPASMSQRIKEAIWNHGMHGEVSIHAYADKNTFSDELERKYSEAGFKLEVFAEGGKSARNYAMYADMNLWSYINPRPGNMILLGEFIEDMLARRISYFNCLGYALLLSDAKPEWYSTPEFEFLSGNTASFLTRIFPGGNFSARSLRKLRSRRSGRSRGARLARRRKKEVLA